MSNRQIKTNEVKRALKALFFFRTKNSTFTLQLNANSSDVVVGAHDLRGRLILNKSISGNGMINETISIQNAQSGIYLVTIQDGSRKITKKVIVE